MGNSEELGESTDTGTEETEKSSDSNEAGNTQCCTESKICEMEDYRRD